MYSLSPFRLNSRPRRPCRSELATLSSHVTTIPSLVRRFVSDHVPSVERLEILLLLCQSRVKAWSVEEIEEQLRTTPESIRNHLAALAEQGLARAVSQPGTGYVYSAEGDDDEALKKLLSTYRTRRVTTIELIYSQNRSERAKR